MDGSQVNIFFSIQFIEIIQINFEIKKSISDFAIEQFKKSCLETNNPNDCDLLEDLKNIPHWRDIIEKVSIQKKILRINECLE